MAQCPASCGTINLPENPEQCVLQVRYKIPSQIGFYACNTSLPDPLAAEAIEDLIASNSIVFTQPLANFTLNDPTFTDIVITDCAPADRIVTSREFTFQDRVALQLTQGSPGVLNEYADYDFWAAIEGQSLSLNYLIKYCDGDVVIAKDINGNPLSANLKVWLNHDTPAAGKKIEFKSGSIIFNGDPLAMFNRPSFNVAADGTVTLIP